MHKNREIVRCISLLMLGAAIGNHTPVAAQELQKEGNDKLSAADNPAQRQPVFRTPPQFPEACICDRTEAFEVDVELEFIVAIDGAVENIRVVSASDDCFTTSAIAAVSQWKYEPARVAEKETTLITYRSSDLDPAALEKARKERADYDSFFDPHRSPKFPEACAGGRTDAFEAFVDVVFDIHANGRAENIRVLGSSDACFIAAAKQTVSERNYVVKSEDSEFRQTGNQTRLTFTFPGVKEKHSKLGSKARRQLEAAFEKITYGENDEAVKILNTLIANTAARLKPFERAIALELRGSAKSSLNDIVGARQDFEAALALGEFTRDRRLMLLEFVDQLSPSPRPASMSVCSQ